MTSEGGDDNSVTHTSTTALLLQSCSSITEKALSCRTLGLISSKDQHYTSSLIKKELELADWLDRNIVDCRAALARQNTDTTSEEAPPTRLQLRLQQQELLDESVRQQQENLLVSRIEMASVVQGIMFPPPTASRRSERDESESLLIQEAIQSRDEQVGISLDRIQQLNGIRSELQAATQESQRLQAQNSSLWQQVGAANNNNRSASTETITEQVAETRVLKRALQDIIAGGDLDWYADKRLRETMQKLET